jgi:hypothetical protein
MRGQCGGALQLGALGRDQTDGGTEGAPLGGGGGAGLRPDAHHDAPEVESAEPLPSAEVRPPPEEDEELSEELLEADESLDEDELSEDELPAELSVPASLLSLPPLLSPLLALELVPWVAEVSASACMVPMRAKTPAVAASVTAAATAAVRRAPLRTSAAAPRSLVVMTVPLP